VILLIEEPSGAEGMLAWGTVSAIVLALGSIIIAGTLAFQVSRMKDQWESLVDENTPSFRETERRSEAREAIAEFAEADTDTAIPVVEEPTRAAPRPSPVPRTDTEENDMPRQIEAAKLEAERDPITTEWREFKRADGSVMKFQVRQ
jgi:hypothetical protein